MSDRGTAWWTDDKRPLPRRPESVVVRRRSEPLVDLDDPERLRAYRQALRDKALSLPRGSRRRREVEKRLAEVTGQLLRVEMKGKR